MSVYDRDKLKENGTKYCTLTETSIADQLGHGTQGMVFRTARNTAIKVYGRQKEFARERDVYRRLRDRNIDSIQRFIIPRIQNWDDTLLVFEMSVVGVPCIIDFGGAYLDEMPEHVVRDEEWEQKQFEDFAENWDEAKAIIRELEYRAGICLADVHPSNIKFF